MHTQWLEAVRSGSDLPTSYHLDTWRGCHETGKSRDRKGNLAVRYQLRGLRSQDVKRRQMCIPGSLLHGALLQTGRCLPNGRGQPTRETHPRGAVKERGCLLLD